ncbi:GNAT family N-acetyltransferase [Micromonospora fluostatini]|uniref:GNAT family N-acetyltransferase n=1 Tax=Micromonospora sp. JCM 30529 TaxID=3421643 RepID=UPI003D1861A2
MEITVTDVSDEQRYEARVDGDLAGYASYLRGVGNVLVLTHTEILPGYEGRGVASTLIRGALDDARHRQRKVVPVCPFVTRFLDRHGAEYADLVHDASTGAPPE